MTDDTPSASPQLPEQPVGRPSTYDPAYCSQVEELGLQGKSPAQISAIIGVPRSTMQLWGEKHPEFLAALKRAKELEQAWWEEAGQRMALMGGQFSNAAVWKKSMEARFRDKYTERRELSGNDGKPIELEVTEIALVAPRTGDGST